MLFGKYVVGHGTFYVNAYDCKQPKCAQYIPEEVGESVAFGEMNVKLKSAEDWADYRVNTLIVTVS